MKFDPGIGDFDSSKLVLTIGVETSRSSE